MPITYTNRKGATYHLYLRYTQTGQPRYIFASESTHPQQAEPVDEVPAGYCIRESVNGMVSLARNVASRISTQEEGVAATALARHPDAASYRLARQRDRLVVYERQGVRTAEWLAIGEHFGVALDQRARVARDMIERFAQYSQVLQFILIDAQARTFRVERMCHLSGIEGWLPVLRAGPLVALVERAIPTLGGDGFYELM